MFRLDYLQPEIGCSGLNLPDYLFVTDRYIHFFTHLVWPCRLETHRGTA